MSWLASILTGLLIALLAGFCGFIAASAAVEWQRISSFEGGAGYFVVLNTLLAMLGGLAIGIVVSRTLGAPGWPGFLTAFAWSAAIAGGSIAVLTGLAWLTGEHEPQVAGQALDLLVEVSVPADLEPAVRRSSAKPHAVLIVGRRPLTADLDLAQGRYDGGRWILSARLGIYSADSQRVLGAALRAVPEQYVDLPLPGRPQPAEGWSEWLTEPFLGNRSSPSPGDAFAFRYRVVLRPPSDPDGAN